MGDIWWTSGCFVDWEYEHGTGWQQDVVSIKWTENKTE